MLVLFLDKSQVPIVVDTLVEGLMLISRFHIDDGTLMGCELGVSSRLVERRFELICEVVSQAQFELSDFVVSESPILVGGGLHSGLL